MTLQKICPRCGFVHEVSRKKLDTVIFCQQCLAENPPKHVKLPNILIEYSLQIGYNRVFLLKRVTVKKLRDRFRVDLQNHATHVHLASVWNGNHLEVTASNELFVAKVPEMPLWIANLLS